ncbi:MAG: hypothetical protein CL910_06020 [Deltaproteobacteria bacterium]|nr:hypothetical protein [Deltaproteobacteria bacterium]
MAGIAAAALGVLAWSFMEYVIHRWLGHDARMRPNPFAAEHVRHHGEGNYFAPIWTKALAAAAGLGLVGGPAIWLAGTTEGLSFAAAFTGSYLGYELLHWRKHIHPGYGAFGRFTRRHHFYHHYTDPKFNHGVTLAFWDRVFRTLRPPGVIRVPERLAMPWLIDPETGDVRAEHAEDYELIPAEG